MDSETASVVVILFATSAQPDHWFVDIGACKLANSIEEYCGPFSLLTMTGMACREKMDFNQSICALVSFG